MVHRTVLLFWLCQSTQLRILHHLHSLVCILIYKDPWKWFSFMTKLQHKGSLTIQTVNDHAVDIVFFFSYISKHSHYENSGWVPDYITTRILLLSDMFNILHLHELHPLKCNIMINVLYKKFHIIIPNLTSQTTNGFTTWNTQYSAITYLSRLAINFSINWLVTYYNTV